MQHVLWALFGCNIMWAAAAKPRPSLEDLAYYYGTDKASGACEMTLLLSSLRLVTPRQGHDDHKYTDLYNALFDPIRNRVLNVTEIGVALGQSLQVRTSITASTCRRKIHIFTHLPRASLELVFRGAGLA